MEIMNPRRHVRLFKPRFAPLVEAGTKCQTIRPAPKREIRKGDILDLRTWTGLPYRSKQRKLREAVCTSCRPCFISVNGLAYIDGERAPKGFAQRDGFPSLVAMGNWFKAEHGLPFSGVLIEWK